MAQSWSILPFPRADILPPLLVKCHFEGNGYTIQLTDLTYVWSETLERRQIIRRALNDNISIDPSEDAGQLKVLLHKISEALQGEKDTSLSLQHGGKEKTLLLSAVASLPAPLRPLVWTILLEPSSQEIMTTEFIFPALSSQVMQNLQISSLLSKIADKDHVISRLLDKLESSGVELASIFPGTAGLKLGKKGSGREIATKYVKGLGLFDEEQWSKETATSTSCVSTQQEIINQIYASQKSATVPKLDAVDHVELSKSWWVRLRHKTVDSNQRQADEDTTAAGELSFLAEHTSRHSSDIENDEFQRQSTPLRSRCSMYRETSLSSNPASEKPLVNLPGANTGQDDETTDEEEEQRSQPLPNTSFPVVNSQKQDTTEATSTRKLGTIGGTEVKPVSPGGIGNRDKGSLFRPSGSGSSSVGSSPASAASDEYTRNQAPSPGPSASHRRLGVIGGKRKYNPPDTSLPSSGELPPPPPPPNKGLGRLGFIGGKGKAQPSTKDDSEPPLSIKTSSNPGADVHAKSSGFSKDVLTEPSSRVEETAQEKADRKREELKRQLREKAKVPAKRQRKF